MGPPLRGHTGYVETVAFSPDGGVVASSGQDHSIRLWDVKSHALISPPLQGHQGTVWSLRFMPSGTALVSASDDGEMLLWDLATPSPLARPLAFEGKGVGDLTISQDGRWVAAADTGGNVVLWRCHDGSCEQPLLLMGHTKGVWKVATAPGSDVVASAGVDRTVRIWNLPTGKPIAPPLLGPTADIYGLAFSPDGDTLAASDYDGTVYFWQWRHGGDAEHVSTGHRTGTMAIAFTPDGTRVAVAADTEVVLVDPRTHRRVAEIGLAGTRAKDVAISKNGQVIAVATADNQIRLFNINSLASLGAPLVGHQSPVSGMAFSPDGRWLASGDDQAVILWDLQTARPLSAPLRVHTSTVSGVAFDPVSERLITGDWNGRVLLWDFSPGRLMRLVCQRAARELTGDELAQYIDVTSTNVGCGASSLSERWALDGPSRVLSKPPADGLPPEQPITIGVLGILNQMVRDRLAQTTSTTSHSQEPP
jgi:WD40 repeat protein